MIPRNLIINADDFGLDIRVSKGIALCVEKGLINSFSVLPFSDSFHDDLLRSLIKRYPETKIGSHLSLINTPTLSPGSYEYPSLREHPNHYRDFLKLYFLGRYPAARIYKEWKAQIQFLGKYLGGPERLAHLDSHQHIHVLPGIWPVAVALQKEFGIPRLRVPYESLSGSIFYKFPFGFALQALALFRSTNSRALTQTGDRRRLLGFFTSTQFTVAANRKRLGNVIYHPEQEFELMVHPALPADSEFSNTLDPEFWVVQPKQAEEVKELEILQELFLSHSKNLMR